MPTVRGSWTVKAAVRQRWQSAGLDATFKSTWPSSQQNGEFLAYNTEEARPNNTRHPLPYCVIEIGTPAPQFGSSGTSSDTIIDTLDVPIQFTIFAGSEEQSIAYAKLVAAEFDRKSLTIQDDVQVEIFRDPDFGHRNDDQTWVWVLQYRLRIEATYAGALS